MLQCGRPSICHWCPGTAETPSIMLGFEVALGPLLYWGWGHATSRHSPQRNSVRESSEVPMVAHASPILVVLPSCRGGTGLGTSLVARLVDAAPIGLRFFRR